MVVSLLCFVHIHGGFLTGGRDLFSLDFGLTVGLLDMHGGSFGILTVLGIDLVSASLVC